MCPDSCLFLPDAYDTAKMLCEKYYLAAPELKIEEFNSRVFFYFLSSLTLAFPNVNIFPL